MRVLVAVASRHGSTAEIAAEISKSLRHANAVEAIDADLRAVEEIATLDGYDAVILGSAIYGGRWLTTAVEFVARHEAELRQLPLWLFSSGPVGGPDAPGQQRAVDVESMARAINAVDYWVFGGKVDRRDLGLSEQLAFRLMRVPDGDFRDWAAVRAWTTEIVERLSASSLT